MKRWLPLTVGTVALLIGAVWTLQGLDYLGGSAMSNEPIWAVIGIVVILGGLLAILFALRLPRR